MPYGSCAEGDPHNIHRSKKGVVYVRDYLDAHHSGQTIWLANQSHFLFTWLFKVLASCAYLHVWHHVCIVYSLYPSSLYEPFFFCHWKMAFRCPIETPFPTITEHALMKGSSILLLKMEGGVEGVGVVFYFFPLFPMCSHGVPPSS
jgi:hypothetical protein